MIMRAMRGIVSGVVVLWLLLGTTGCGSFNAQPPQNVVAQAVAIQAAESQRTLWQQLALNESDSPKVAVRQVKVRQTRPVTVASMPAYEVAGTYQYQIRYPNRRRVKQSQVPYTIIVKSDSETEDWQLLRLSADAVGDRTWAWQPLSES